MIQVGLAGWGDHDELYPIGMKSTSKLGRYHEHFAAVECDSTFYAVPSQQVVHKWVDQTPPNFHFIVKAYQGMTGHRKMDSAFTSNIHMFDTFKQAIAPMIEANKLACVLFQYPPWFKCERNHVDILRRTRAWMGEIPVALEFRHQSWFRGDMREKTLEFMREENWIHSVCDEPQAGEGSIPAVIEGTHAEMTMVRMHGRHIAGWVNEASSDNWREVRYLYNYNVDELQEWVGHVRQLEQHAKHVIVIFNNNSGGHAAGNAKQFMQLLGQQAAPMAPRQISLFD
ncbi:DUF72 domain-containing protein [Paenibacillus assamensis]|uniref:DUF72 domain-containing protein n=1 Tax=Paenibacillus assamensis TaxID=311244 RepID=UPI00040B13DD|nr:DUF72 domain-containing protein [Paenibacillus assamensis]